jgi:hypothetical protein
MSDIVIEIIDVAIETKGTYEKMSVTHKSTDYQGKPKVDAKAIFSFSTPKDVWDTLKFAHKGQVFSIGRKKDEKEGKYWNWVEIHRQDGEVVSSTEAKAVPAKAATFADNDAKRQRLIVRQSSLSSAVALHKDNGGVEEDVLKTAERFVAWVFEE